jgi:hypothetical protein
MMTSLSAGGGGGSIWAGLRDIDEGGGGEGKLRESGRREEKREREERPRLALWVEPVFGKWLCHESM